MSAYLVIIDPRFAAHAGTHPSDTLENAVEGARFNLHGAPQGTWAIVVRAATGEQVRRYDCGKDGVPRVRWY